MSGDYTDEGSAETINLTLVNPDNATFGDDAAVGTITDNDAQPTTAREQHAHQLCAGPEHVLAVVEDQQRLAASEVLCNRIGELLTGLLLEPEGRGHRLRDQRLIADRGQFDHPGAVRETVLDRSRQSQREPGLAAAP